MPLRRVFVDSLSNGLAEVRGERAHHLARVARLRPGERVEVSDQKRAWAAEAVEVSDKKVRFRLVEGLPSPPPRSRVELFLAVVKLPRFEWAVEKATELGVDLIAPVAAERSEPGPIQAAAKRRDRLQRIADEAAQQARRLRAPEVLAPISLADALARPADRRLWVDFGGAAIEGATADQTVALFVGPEGGWTEEETAQATAAGAEIVSLGPTVLRAETAAVVAAALARSSPEDAAGL